MLTAIHDEDFPRLLRRPREKLPQTKSTLQCWCDLRLSLKIHLDQSIIRPERFERPTPRFVVWCFVQLTSDSLLSVELSHYFVCISCCFADCPAARVGFPESTTLFWANPLNSRPGGPHKHDTLDPISDTRSRWLDPICTTCFVTRDRRDRV